MKSVRYNQGDEILEVTVRDATGARIEVRRCNLKDDREINKLIKWLVDKYNVRIKYDNKILSIDSEFIKF